MEVVAVPHFKVRNSLCSTRPVLYCLSATFGKVLEDWV